METLTLLFVSLVIFLVIFIVLGKKSKEAPAVEIVFSLKKSTRLRIKDSVSEGMVFELNNPEPGLYSIPPSAFDKGDQIEINASVIFFMDDALTQEFNEWYQQTGSGSSQNHMRIIYKLNEFETRHNCKIGYALANGEESRFFGPGSCDIDTSKIKKK